MASMKAHRRHDISDNVWHLLEPHLPGRSGSWGGIARDNRLFINAVFWIMRTGAPWRDLPPDYGCWSNITADLFAGEIKASGNSWWKYWLTSQTMNGWWLMPVTARCILMRQEPKKAIRTWIAQKGAQHKIASGRGCAWYAGQGYYYRRYNSRLYSS